MKIAVLSNFGKEISPTSTGGTEVFTYLLSQELAKRDTINQIVVYGVGKNFFQNNKIVFREMLPQSALEFIKSNPTLSRMYIERSDFWTNFRSSLMLKTFMELLNSNYDIIHNNITSSVFNTLLGALKTPVVTTLHTNADSPSIMIPYELGCLKNARSNYFITVANHQKLSARVKDINLNIIGNVYNGISVQDFSFAPDTINQSYGFWLGRTNKLHNKGIKEAILTSERVKKELIIATKIDDQSYYDLEIEPITHKFTKIVTDPLSFKQRISYYQNASYFLYPIQWEEPFGLVFIESMACGTPVIAFARGSVPEVIKDGETGFIVNPSDDDIRGDWIIKKTGIEGLCEAVERIYNMPNDQYVQMRKNCRAHVEKNFTVERMVDEYKKVYQEILNKR